MQTTHTHTTHPHTCHTAHTHTHATQHSGSVVGARLSQTPTELNLACTAVGAGTAVLGGRPFAGGGGGERPRTSTSSTRVRTRQHNTATQQHQHNNDGRCIAALPASAHAMHCCTAPRAHTATTERAGHLLYGPYITGERQEAVVMAKREVHALARPAQRCCWHVGALRAAAQGAAAAQCPTPKGTPMCPLRKPLCSEIQQNHSPVCWSAGTVARVCALETYWS